MKLHDKAFIFLEKYRHDYPSFFYWLRHTIKDVHIQQRFWFQGDDSYAKVGFYKMDGGDWYSKSIGLSFIPVEGIIEVFFEINFPVTKIRNDEKMNKFYEELATFFNIDMEVDTNSNKKYSLQLSDKEDWVLVTNFLNSKKSKIDIFLEKYGLVNQIINQKEFELSYRKMSKYKLYKNIVEIIENNNKIGETFVISKQKLIDNCIWLKDKNGFIEGNKQAHYEIILREKHEKNGEKIYVELHFEGYAGQFIHDNLDIASTSYYWREKPNVWAQLQKDNPLDINSENIVEQIIEQLVDLRDRFGDQVKKH